MDLSSIELRHLRYFVAVAEELHFGRAAERLRLSQPPLSQQIRALESMLGAPLFDRTSRTVRLTEAGTALLERARRTLANLQRDLQDTASVGQGEAGSLQVGFIGSAMLQPLPEIFRLYRQSFPRVKLQLSESFTSRVMEGLTSGALDAGLVRDSDDDDAIERVPLFREPYVAVLPAAHPHARDASVSPGALAAEPFIYYPPSAGVRAYEKPLALFEAFGTRPRVVQEASHWVSIVRLVGAGLGISVAPACVRRIATSDVVCIPLRGTRATSVIELARRRGDKRPIVEGFARVALRLRQREGARPHR